MSGTQRIEAPAETVYAALNDAEVLRQCIPGCESIDKTSATTLKARVTLKIGPMKVTFNGNVTLSDLHPPTSYTITGEGSGGVAGFAKGGATVRLDPDGEATLLTYQVKAEVGGKIAQLGARLIDGTARKLAGEFFGRLGTVVASEPVEGAAVPDGTDGEADSRKPGWFGRAFDKTA